MLASSYIFNYQGKYKMTPYYSKNCLLKKRVYGIQFFDLPLHVKLNSAIQQGTKWHSLPP